VKQARPSPRRPNLPEPAEPAAQPAEAPGTAPRRILGGWARLLSPLALLLIWQLCSAGGLLPERILASPAQIAATAWDLLRSGELLRGLFVSFLRVAAGFCIALVLGVALAVLSGLSRIGDLVVDPVLQMLKAMPFLGLLPLFILWFGIGEAPKIGLVAVGAIFPIYLTLHAGIRGLDLKLVEAGRSLGLTRLERVRHIILPGALPSLLVGVRYGLSTAWLSLVVGEQINASSGLGALITNARDFLQTDVIVVCLLVYAAMGLATDGLVRLLEARGLRWRRPVTAA
jgi:sulfonate transport system permease protein